MKKFLDSFKKMETIQKVEFILATLFTLAVIVSIPVYAWFSFSNNLETMTKVKEPDDLDIRAGNFDAIINFDLRDVSIEDLEDGSSKYYVFSVSGGDYKIPYNIQLAHTTNIPFTYKLYRATRHETYSDGYIEYHPRSNVDEKTYYAKGAELTLTDFNKDNSNSAHYGRAIAIYGDDYYSKVYTSSNTTEVYAVPLYSQTESAITPTSTGANEHDYFILEMKWDEPTESTGFDNWNKAENNKETDIIYITAARSTN